MSPLAFSSLFVAAIALTLALKGWLGFRQLRHVAAHRAEVPAAFAGAITLAAHRRAGAVTAGSDTGCRGPTNRGRHASMATTRIESDTIIINGQSIPYEQMNLEMLRQIIDAELAKNPAPQRKAAINVGLPINPTIRPKSEPTRMILATIP